MADTESPRIRLIEWGRIETECSLIGRDLKLWPGGGREWDWRETNTHHVPGIQMTDVREVLERGADTVVLSRGMELVLRTPQETIERLRELGIEVHVLETLEAARKYNDLVAAGRPVGGLFHSTC